MSNADSMKQGICIYNKAKEYKVKIIRWDVLYGTGDFEDPEEIRDDKFTECYYVLYEDLTREGVFNVRDGGYLSLEEAVSSIEAIHEVKWV